MDITLPHIKYLPDPKHSRLTIGRKYRLYTAMYAENKFDERERVWVCSDDGEKYVKFI